MQKLNLLPAAQLLASLTKKPHLKDDVIGIIRAGAEGRIPVYWFKPKFLTTKLSNFSADWKHTDSLCDWLQIQPHDLHELARTGETDVINFELSADDKNFLDKTPQPVQLEAKEGETVFIGDPGFRHANYQPVTIRRDQLFVFESDLMAYAATLGIALLNETAEVRQKRRYDACIAAGLNMPTDTYAHLPTGIGELARAEGISVPAFSKDIKAYIERNR